ncbi:serine hydrolase [Pullulanibacillus sp. KACC 23026]|uniref:serine hydrolase n=1 Tax=Pullulanibacillus sp. KACC 23026 TaxID=3028315 RepID=UPI0023B0E79E|nr:serine hydrolase [Pullulanibacillus sp. KACC 23026]WEG15038.1 serine hydrolase [Pullulanibacillus sp. KACC 23026]
MQKILNKLNEIELGEVGILVYSVLKQEVILSLNQELEIPLASAAKVAIAFCIAKFVEEEKINWNDIVGRIQFNRNENSNQIYPHFQHRDMLPLRDAVEVMIACHDSFVANRVVEFSGGWEVINEKLKRHFNNINVTEDPRDVENKGQLIEVFNLLKIIFQGYKANPELWAPIINGLVRQKDDVKNIPPYILNHMTGGLDNVVVDLGILGEFTQNPLLYVLGAIDLPNRFKNNHSDEKILESIELLYENYLNQEK